MQQGAYGNEMGTIVRVPPPPTLGVSLRGSPALALTRVACDEPEHGLTEPIPGEEAYLLSLQLRGFGAHELWLGGQHLRVAHSQPGTFMLVDLRAGTVASLPSPFDSFHVYMPRMALALASGESDGRAIDTLHFEHGVPLDDPIVRHLCLCLLPSLYRPERANQLFLEHVTLALLTHLLDAHGQAPARWRPPTRGTLALWQERRVKELLLAHLDGNVSLEQIAHECGMSRSHLARAFKVSTGQSPHRWLSTRRIERARHMLSHTPLPLADIARRCGFADQSHFTRVMGAALGLSPGLWRRRQRR